MEHDPYFWTANFEPQHLRIDGVDFTSAGAPSVGYAFSLLYDASRLMRRARRETVGALHDLHLKRVIRHVVISSVSTDKKVVVPIVELARLAHERAEAVYRQYCAQESAMTVEQITRSFADNGCQTIKDLARHKEIEEHFRLYPEMVGCGEKTSWVSVLSLSGIASGAQLLQQQTEVARDATFILDDWLGDDCVVAQRSYLVTERLLELLQMWAISGFTAAEVKVRKTGKFPAIESVARSLEKTKFFRLELTTDKDADLFVIPHVAIFASRKALEVFAEVKMRYALFIKGHP